MPTLAWDIGTGYDLFMSLQIILNPADYDVSASWAAGMRARLPAPEREFLEECREWTEPPLRWLHALPPPKDGASVLRALAQQAPHEIFLSITVFDNCDEIPASLREIIGGVCDHGSWSDKDLQLVQSYFQNLPKEKRFSQKALTGALNWCTRAGEFGERYLKSLRAFYEVFFAEEETRIRPALEDSLAKAQALTESMPILDLLEVLSQGLRFAEPPKVAQLILIPSFWISPLVLFYKIDSDHEIWLYGARPPEVSLIPGETVPDNMLRALKALSDPTRLRIMRYLTEESLAPSQLSKRLRLRPPTVVHHLKILRLAGLVQLNVGETLESRSYAVRREAVTAVCAMLQSFLNPGTKDLKEPNPPS